jgi:hypothetical protein
MCEREQRVCAFCSKPFVPRRAWQKYCSPTCSNRAKNKRSPVMRVGGRKPRLKWQVTRHYCQIQRRSRNLEASGRWGDCMRFLAELKPALILRIVSAGQSEVEAQKNIAS